MREYMSGGCEQALAVLARGQSGSLDGSFEFRTSEEVPVHAASFPSSLRVFL